MTTETKEQQLTVASLPADGENFEMATTSGSLMLAGGAAFSHIQRVAKMFSSSSLIPDTFKGNIANCVIALEMAHRMGANPMAVMQNLYIVHGRPGWSAQFIIACLNQCGKFSPLRFRIIGDGDQKTCTAWAKELETGETLEGPPVSIAMAKKEGWYGKTGSKWQTMEDLMLRYRAATFFGRLYAPDLLMGMQTVEEIADVTGAPAVRDVTPAKVPLPFMEAAPLTLSADAPTPLETLKSKLNESGLTWERLSAVVEKGGIPLNKGGLEDQDEGIIADILSEWSSIVKMATKK